MPAFTLPPLALTNRMRNSDPATPRTNARTEDGSGMARRNRPRLPQIAMEAMSMTIDRFSFCLSSMDDLQMLRSYDQTDTFPARISL